jgi:heat shock protein HslJ
VIRILKGHNLQNDTMKIRLTFCILTFSLFLQSCGGGKASAPEFLFAAVWELEFLADTDQGFQVLFPDITPELTFEQAAGEVVGNSGCNGYQAPYTLKGDEIRFGEPGPSTLRFCGDGENLFRKLMQQVDQWRFTDDGQLELLADGRAVLRFRSAVR